MERWKSPQKVSLREVGPRDGLQAEPQVMATADKIALVDRLTKAGLPRIEVTSFVSPEWLPQMADAEQVMAGISRRPGTRYSVLVPNVKGAERALVTHPDELTLFLSASATHNWKNVHRTIEESLAGFRQIAEWVSGRVPLSAVIVTAFGCPYEGEVPRQNVLGLADRLVELGIHEITLGDTVGVANPRQVFEMIRALAERQPDLLLGLHFHDNRGTALANLVAALTAGADRFETALGGIGGSPFSPGAGGNLATDDAVYLLEEMGVNTGVDLDQLLAATQFLVQKLDHPVPSRVFQSKGRMVPKGGMTDAG